jgi:hypothetical protein
VEITDYPEFTVEPIAKDSSNLKAGLKFQFNESKTGFDMIVNDSQKNTFYEGQIVLQNHKQNASPRLEWFLILKF